MFIKKFDKDVLALFVLFMVIIAAFYFYGNINWRIQPYASHDLRSYIIMAESQCIAEARVSQPYCYRWLGSLLAGAMPFDMASSFRILTWFSCTAFLVTFYLFLRTQYYSTLTTLGVVLVIIFNKYIFGMVTWNFFQLSDSITLALLVGLFWALEAKSWIWFAILLAIGAATKETNMLMIPVAGLVVLLNLTKRNIIGVVLSVLPAVLIFIAIRVLSNHSGGLSLIEAFQLHSLKLSNPEKLSKMFINIWVPISFFPLIFFRDSLDFFKRRPYCFLFVLLVYLASLFGGDVERLLAPTGIVMYWLLADIVKNSHYSKKLLLITVVGAFISCWHHEIGRFNIASQKHVIILSCFALMLTSVVAIYYRTKGKFTIMKCS